MMELLIPEDMFNAVLSVVLAKGVVLLQYESFSIGYPANMNEWASLIGESLKAHRETANELLEEIHLIIKRFSATCR